VCARFLRNFEFKKKNCSMSTTTIPIPKKKVEMMTTMRPQVEFKPRYQRFVVGGSKKSFEVQYSHLYQKRLKQLRESVKRNVRAQFGKSIILLALNQDTHMRMR